VIFDENVPTPLRQYLPGHQVTTVQEQGWTGISNGDLVNRGEEQFDVLLLAEKICVISRIFGPGASH
jgi:hypothetical protein